MKTFVLVFFCALFANADEFLISIEKHSAFYSFPKNKEHADQVREFLKSQGKKKQVLILEIDPVSANIYSIKTK